MSACKFVARDLPRILPGRHQAECALSGSETAHGAPKGVRADYGDLRVSNNAPECPGCQPCTGPHCRVCVRAHAEQTCPECVASARDDLHAIAIMCGSLPAEVAHRGVNGEAMMLLGPSADPEARAHVEAAYVGGRLPEGWIEAAHGKDCPLLSNDYCTGCAGDELHPGFILATWDMIWRDHLDQPSNLKATLPRLVDYLDQHVHRMAEEDLIPFEDFARDLRRCRGHLESVLHDQPRGDIAGVGCFECGHDLERRLTPAGFADVWTCRGCRQVYTSAEYNFALRASLEAAREEAS